MSVSITELTFEKWQGCLNDFLLVAATTKTLIPTMRLLTRHVRELCAKDGSGVGADGVILVCAGAKAHDLDYQPRWFFCSQLW